MPVSTAANNSSPLFGPLMHGKSQIIQVQVVKVFFGFFCKYSIVLKHCFINIIDVCPGLIFSSSLLLIKSSCFIRSLFHLFLALWSFSSVLDTFGGVNFLWFLFISLFKPIFKSVLLTKISLLYPFVFPMFKFKLFRRMYISMPTEKSAYGNACSSTPWDFSISIPIE